MNVELHGSNPVHWLFVPKGSREGFFVFQSQLFFFLTGCQPSPPKFLDFQEPFHVSHFLLDGKFMILMLYLFRMWFTLFFDVNHEMDIELHGWGPPPRCTRSCTKVHCHERWLLYFFNSRFFCFSFSSYFFSFPNLPPHFTKRPLFGVGKGFQTATYFPPPSHFQPPTTFPPP